MKILAITLTYFCLVASGLHPLHISVTEIEYDAKEKELEVMVRIFADDLERTLQQEKKSPDLDVLNPKGTTTDKLLEEYLLAHIKVSIDDNAQQLKYLGHEEEGEALICYIQVANVKKWKKIKIMNDILVDMFDDQSNLVHVTVNGDVKSLRLVNTARQGELIFNSK